MTIVYALLAALGNALNVITQHTASVSAPPRSGGWRLVGYLLRSPLWLVGWIALAAAFVFQALALHSGQMSVVQPLLVTELVFALVLRRFWIHQSIRAVTWWAAVATCAGLAVFLATSEPQGGRVSPASHAWLSAGGVTISAAALLALLSMRGTPRRRAALLACATGTMWALVAAFIKTMTGTLSRFGVGGMFAHWPVYALAVSGAVTEILEQATLHVGPLSVSQPFLVIVDPIMSVALSVWIFDEYFTENALRLALGSTSFVAMCVAVAVLTRTAPASMSTPSGRRGSSSANASGPTLLWHRRTVLSGRSAVSAARRPAVGATDDAHAMLRDRAAAVLHGNDAGTWTRASAFLYPHQWSWDSAFIAIGWAHLDVRRAMTELEGLFAAQWSTGMVPHLVFRAGSDHPYFPGPQWWDTPSAPAAAGLPVQTTGICQPPVHALAVQRIWQLTPEPQQQEIRERVRALYPRLVRWHRYLATHRDPEASGLVTTFHPWEGTDNSPRWDEALERIKVAKPGPYTRLDITELGDPSQRPSTWDYDRFLWLVEQLRKYKYDDARIYREYPFLIKDVFFSAIFVAANAALLDLADVAGAGDSDRQQLASWLERGREGLKRRFDTESGLCVDYDVRNGNDIKLRTFAGFAPLFARTADQGQREAQMRLLDSEDFCGNPRLRWRLLPSTSPSEPAFEPHDYWRGPVWPVISWLLWQSLRELGYTDRAEQIRSNSLSQIAIGEINEYFEPFTGAPLGSPQQSWTAAVTLDWSAQDPQGIKRPPAAAGEQTH